MAALSTEQLCSFIQHGYLVIKPSVKGGPSLHRELRKVAESLDTESELGNNCVPLLPGIEEVLDAPEMRGALTTILGDGYVLTPHRHCHAVYEESPSQPFHRDSFFSFEQFRHWLPMEVMVYYYPQAVSRDMGPTAIMPGSQYHRGRVNQYAMELNPASWADALSEVVLTTDEPGVCVLVHYHLWHRATSRSEGRTAMDGGSLDKCPQTRYMVKLQFRRVQAFSQPLSQKISEAFSSENPYIPFCTGAGLPPALESLPAALSSVLQEYRASWVAEHAPIWATIWQALAQGRSSSALAKLPWAELATQDARSKSFLAELMKLEQGGGEGSFVGFSSVEIAAALTSKNATANVRFAAAYAAAAQIAFASAGLQNENELPLWDIGSGSTTDQSSRGVHDVLVPLLCQQLGASSPDQQLGASSPENSPEMQARTPPAEGDNASDHDNLYEPKSIKKVSQGPRWGEAEQGAFAAWLGRSGPLGSNRCVPPTDVRWFAAAVLQQLPAPCAPGSRVAECWMEALAGALSENASNEQEMQAFAADWRSEALLATPAILSAEDAVRFLQPFLQANEEPRVQFHAAVALYSTGLRCGAPAHNGWQAAATKVQLDETLVQGVSFWMEFAVQAQSILQQELKRRKCEGDAYRYRGPLQPQDRGGRYGLAEMLRCIGAFCPRDVVLRTASLAGGDSERLLAGDEAEWRRRFNQFVERHFICPITSPFSPF